KYMENKGNDRKYMDGHGNDWKQVEASRVSGNKLADTCFQQLLWLSGRFYSFRQVLRLSAGFWGSGFLGQVLAGSSASGC
ncbi:hypothetical protein BDZ91DRAFT_721086, partial [Kalaharituber pfeilii]